MSDLEQVFLPSLASLPPQNEANTNTYNNNGFHGSIIEVRNDNAFEYFYSIVGKKMLSESLLVFPFSYIGSGSQYYLASCPEICLFLS